MISQNYDLVKTMISLHNSSILSKLWSVNHRWILQINWFLLIFDVFLVKYLKQILRVWLVLVVVARGLVDEGGWFILSVVISLTLFLMAIFCYITSLDMYDMYMFMYVTALDTKFILFTSDIMQTFDFLRQASAHTDKWSTVWKLLELLSNEKF